MILSNQAKCDLQDPSKKIVCDDEDGDDGVEVWDRNKQLCRGFVDIGWRVQEPERILQCHVIQENCVHFICISFNRIKRKILSFQEHLIWFLPHFCHISNIFIAEIIKLLCYESWTLGFLLVMNFEIVFRRNILKGNFLFQVFKKTTNRRISRPPHREKWGVRM